MTDTWEAVRVLDEAENWAVRNEVVTKSSHNELVGIAKDIVHELVESLPIDKVDAQVVDFTDDDFKYSSEQFDVDYLESLKTETSADISALTRQSIYVKFDPLVSTQSSKSATAQTHMQNVALGNQGRDLLVLDTPPSALNRVQLHHKDYYETSGFSPVSRESHRQPRGSDDSSPAIPVTSCLVKVLKYSDEDLNKLVSLAKRRAYQREKEKMETELLQLREMIDGARSQVKSHRDRVHVLDSKRLTHLSRMSQTDDERKKIKLKAVEKNESIKEKLRKYQEFQKVKGGFDHYQSVLAKDQMQVETAFDELHGHYVKQKETNKRLMKWNKQAEIYLSKLREWHQHTSQEVDELRTAKQAMKDEFTQRCEAVRREHETKLAVERTKTKKLMLTHEKLRVDLLDMEQGKEELTQICDDLMKQLEFNTET